jgi:hypothetical protein
MDLRTTGILTLFSVLALSACSDTASELTEPPSASAPVTSVLLTDAPFPFDRIERVDVYIVAIHAAENADTGASQSGLITVVSPRQRFDLLSLQGGATASLGDTTLPAAVLRSVRVTIDTDSSSMTMNDGSVLTGTSWPGINWQGTGEKQLNALVHEPVEISDTGAVVVIDFDVGRSFLPAGTDTTRGSTGFLFIPYIRAVNSAATGSITGIVVNDSGTPVPDATVRVLQGDPAMPENTWGFMSSGRTDSAGGFRVAYLWPRTYLVTVDAPYGSPFTSAVIPNVAVSSGGEAALGTVQLFRP